MKNALASLALALLAAGAAQAAAPAPQVGIASFDALPKPLPLPYDEAANAHAAIAKARAEALRTHKRLLIDLGGNWCLDCRILAGTIGVPALHRFVDAHYVEVTVDIGRFDKNMDVPAGYGIARPEGVPALLVIDPRTNRLLNKGDVAALADARHMSPQGLADYLAKYAG